MADKDSSLAASLNKLSELSSSSDSHEVAKVKQRRSKVKEQAWVSDDSANNLLAGLISDVGSKAQEEIEGKQAKLRAAEEAEKAEKAAEEEKKRLEAEEKLKLEEQRFENVQKRRTQMLAAIEREKKIEAGEIDLEEEARQKREEEERIRKEEEENAAKEAELAQAQSVILQQEQKLKELANRPLDAALTQPKSSVGVIVAIAAVVTILAGAAIFFVLKYQQGDVDVYALSDSYPTASISLLDTKASMVDVQLSMVKQSAEVVPSSGGSRNRGKRSNGNSGANNAFKDLGNTKASGILDSGKGGGIKF